MSKVIFISFATKDFIESQKKNIESIKKFIQRPIILEYSPKDIDQDFIKKNREVFSVSRGFGLWLWKPYLICRAQDTLKNGDIVFYTDSATTYISNPVSMLPAIYASDCGLLSFELRNHPERFWTKGETFAKLNCLNPEYYNTPQRCAAFQIFRVTDFTRSFYNEYLNWCSNFEVVSDMPSIDTPDFPGFKEHRHDQSIYSLLCKKYRIQPYRDPSQFGNSSKNNYHNSPYPQILNHHRENSKSRASKMLLKINRRIIRIKNQLRSITGYNIK